MGRKVAGCVPVRKRASTGEYEVMMVKSRWVEGVWLFPKGGVEKDEQAKMSAIRETREEAGVVGKLGPKLGSYKNERNKETHKMWVLFVDEEYDEKDKRWKERGKRERKWFTFEEASKVLRDLDEEVLHRTLYFGNVTRTVRPELIEMLEKSKKKLDEAEKELLEEDDDEDED